MLRLLGRVLDRLSIDDGMPAIIHVARRAANAVPALIIGHGIWVVPHLSPAVRSVIGALADAIVVLTIARMLSELPLAAMACVA